MCGRYTLVNLAQFLGTRPWVEQPVGVPPPRYNVAPQQDVPVVVGTGDGRGRVETMRWGLVPPWATDPSAGSKMINARAETLLERPAFRGPLSKGQRCLVPVDGFYEWAKAGEKRQPYRVRMKTGEPFALAGLWDEWHDAGGGGNGGTLRTFTIITAEPNELVRPLHHRMTVILPPAACRRWLAKGPLPAEELAALLVPYAAEEMEAYPVSSAVGDVRVERADLIDRVEVVEPVEPQMTLFG